MREPDPRWIPAFFAVAACSWVPHWSCHFYRLETGSTFSVGSWDYSRRESQAALVIYAALIFANVWAVATPRVRAGVAIVSGTLHLAFAALHFFRLWRPFRFEVFGYPWSLGASLREALILSAFGALSIAIGVRCARVRIDSE
jgi:hypothetical protein